MGNGGGGLTGPARARYSRRGCACTQGIGAAIAFLGLDGLIAPAARWRCDNLVIFTGSHQLTERLEPVDSEEVEWRGWAREHGLVGADDPSAQA